jgi:hypothetical protein
VGAELFHADGQTGKKKKYLTKLMVAFRNYANAPKKVYSSSVESKYKEHGAKQSTAMLGAACSANRSTSKVQLQPGRDLLVR